MKVLHFIISLRAGGKERQAVELLKGLVLQHKEVQMEVVVMEDEIHYTEIFELGLPVHKLLRRSKKDLSVFSRFYRLCRTFKPDIIHCWDSMTAIYAVPVARLLGIRLLNNMIQDAPAQRNYKNKDWLRGRLTFPFSHAIVGNSKAGLDAYGVKGKKRFCIYNGYAIERTAGLAEPAILKEQLNIQQEKVVGMVASFSKYKDYKTYFHAASILLTRQKDIVFLAIGAGTDSAEAKALILPELMPHFRLLGAQTGIEAWIRIMDDCVLSTFTEGISNSILEYMAMEKPVLATDGGGTAELVEDGENGFLLRTSDADQQAEKMAILLNDADLRHAMGKKGRQKVIDIFANQSMVNAFAALYAKLTAGKTVHK